DVVQREVELGLLGRGEQVQDGVGGATHGDVHGHGVLERGTVGDGARQHGGVVVEVVGLGDVHNRAAGVLVQILAGGVRGQRGAVARQRQAQGLGEAVHRVGGEHARAGTAGGAGCFLDAQKVLVGDRVVHCV